MVTLAARDMIMYEICLTRRCSLAQKAADRVVSLVRTSRYAGHAAHSSLHRNSTGYRFCFTRSLEVNRMVRKDSKIQANCLNIILYDR